MHHADRMIDEGEEAGDAVAYKVENIAHFFTRRSIPGAMVEAGFLWLSVSDVASDYVYLTTTPFENQFLYILACGFLVLSPIAIAR